MGIGTEKNALLGSGGGAVTIEVTGASETSYDTYTVQTWTSDGSFVVDGGDLDASYFIIGGGGSGGGNGLANQHQGGGGAGEYHIGTPTLAPGTYTVTVGDGGPVTPGNGSNGSETSIVCTPLSVDFDAAGGGCGGHRNANGCGGGCGGGGGTNGSGGSGSGGTGPYSYGYPGGNSGPNSSGGGGGTGATGNSGGDPGSQQGGKGGDYRYNDLQTGSNIEYGGGGSGNGNGGAGGGGGGGAGGSGHAGQAAQANKGSGGGGGSKHGPGGAGGSGLVVLRYTTL